jgi:hypothetical protein
VLRDRGGVGSARARGGGGRAWTGRLSSPKIGAAMIGRLHHLICDTPDPRRSARFWSALLDSPITYDSGDFVVVPA